MKKETINNLTVLQNKIERLNETVTLLETNRSLELTLKSTYTSDVRSITKEYSDEFMERVRNMIYVEACDELQRLSTYFKSLEVCQAGDEIIFRPIDDFNP